MKLNIKSILILPVPSIKRPKLIIEPKTSVVILTGSKENKKTNILKDRFVIRIQ